MQDAALRLEPLVLKGVLNQDRVAGLENFLDYGVADLRGSVADVSAVGVERHVEHQFAAGVDRQQEAILRREHLDQRRDGDIQHLVQLEGRVHLSTHFQQPPKIEVCLG